MGFSTIGALRRGAADQPMGTGPGTTRMPHCSGDDDPTANTIKVMTTQVSKGLEFPVVTVAGQGAFGAVLTA